MKHTFDTRRWMAVAAVLTFVLLLLLSQGFVISGDDWFFTSRTMDESFLEALEAGWGSAEGHYRSTNGRLLGNALSRGLGCSEFWREIVRCCVILTILLQLFRLAKGKDLVAYLCALLLVVALPDAVYAQSYAWAAGFFNYVPPLVFIFAYIFRAERVLAGESERMRNGVTMALTALACQFFVEHVTIGLCLLSFGVLAWHLVRSRRLSPSLTGFFLGAVLGCVIMFLAPGYANVNQEGYRQVKNTFAELFVVIQDNFGTITMYLTEDNWRLILPLTILSVLLLMGAGNKPGIPAKLAMVALFVCPVWFYANYKILRTLNYLQWVKDLRFILDLVFNLCYLLAVLTAAVLGLRDKVRMRRAVLCIATVPLIFGPLVVVYPIGPRCMYIPYLLLAALVLIFGCDLMERLEPAQKKCLTAPVALLTACVITCYLWVSVWNGHCERVRVERIEGAMAQGAAQVEIPSFPYATFVHSGNGSAIDYYYYYEYAGDLDFIFVDHRTWSIN